MVTTTSVSCKGCHQQFSSKNQLFRHLSQKAKLCLSPEEYRNYLEHVVATKREKIGVLYGYLPGSDYVHARVCHAPCGIEGGQHAAWLVTQAIDRVSHQTSGTTPNSASWSATNGSKINRSYGSISRESDAVAQDLSTGAITEVLCTTALPLSLDEDSADNKEQESESVTKTKEKETKEKAAAWVGSINAELDSMLSEMEQKRSSLKPSTQSCKWYPGKIKAFGRVSIPQKKFNAETDVVHRRIDYCLPADLLYASNGDDLSRTGVQLGASSLQEYCDSLHSFPPGNKPYSAGDGNLPHKQTPLDSNRPSERTLAYFHRMKKLMKRITTGVEDLDISDSGAVLEKGFHDAKRKKKKRKESKTGKDSTSSKDPLISSKRVLKRKRFHNFCPNILAHDFLAYRRLDRIYHRATIRLEESTLSDENIRDSTVSFTTIQNRPFIVLSLTGDLFLKEQAVRVIGLLIAICRGVIHDDIIDCIFDEEFTSLVPAPPAPRIGLLSAEATYMTWEGRMKTILSARRTDRYDKGWNDDEVVEAVEEWEKSLLNDVARNWCGDGVAEDGRLNTGTQWLENVLYPWARETRPLLDEYRRWKASSISKTAGPSFLPSLKSIDSSVPILFEQVLHHLRQADASGLWPSTTPNRQLVMLSTSSEGGSQAKTLSVSHVAAKKNSVERSSAYSFKEGEGGASGSFSVGAMPGQCGQPKGNALFSDLVKAAFELEVALRPDREPSSTIAINRNAQFRPHTDNGAGAGQSKSLIVGLGNYVGGELVVEGAKKDIRYQAIEFDGWKERHWTLPFQGERYSLVWFTPKGCEGVRGIDLDLS